MIDGFSTIAKDEIVLSKLNSNDAKIAFLSAIIHTAGSIFLNSEGVELIIESENEQIKQRIDGLLEELYNTKSLENVPSPHKIVLSGNYLFMLLDDLHILSLNAEREYEIERGIDTRLVRNESLVQAYVKGAFLGAGSVSIKKGYHLEFVLSSKIMADDLLKLLISNSLCAKSIKRNNSYIVYSKAADSISDILAFMGANRAVLTLNSEFADRQANMRANRLFNCDIANIDKSVIAASAQLSAINKLILEDRLDSLDEKLYETAMLRLQYSEDSLDELALILGITKSGVRHRLIKIAQIAVEEDNKS